MFRRRPVRAVVPARAAVPALALAVALALVAPALTVAGCGSGDRQRATPVATARVYVAQVDRALAAFRRDYRAVQRDLATPTSTPPQERRALDRLRLGVDRLVLGLRAVRAPDAVARLHRTLVANVLRYDPVIARRRAAAGDASRAVLAANTRFRTDIAAINDAISATIARIDDDLAR